MRSTVFIPFLIGYLLCCVYVYVRAAQALPKIRWLRVAWLFVLVVFGTGFFTGMAFRETVVLGLPAGYWLRTLGVTWIVSLPYWVVAAVFWDAVRLANKCRHFFPTWVSANYARAKLLALGASVACVGAVFAIGHWRFTHPVTTALVVKVNKPPGAPAAPPHTHAPDALRIAVASDLHLGDIIGVQRLRGYVERINALKPDIILLPGDIVDRSVEPLEKQNMGPELAKLRAPLGVYAVLGNHEGYARAERCAAFLKKHGIRVLIDETVDVNGMFYLVGRKDFSLWPRASLAALLAGADRSRPVIVMDHQPRELGEPAAAGVDLQFSGHTHGGQFWPVTWIVPFMYEVTYGYARKGDFQLYVSSGLGLWGFPARIGSVSEVVDVRVEFAK